MSALTQHRSSPPRGSQWLPAGNHKPLRCLWISRDIPFPQDAGDRIYSAQLAASLARAGAQVRVMGFLDGAADVVPAEWPVDWVAVPGRRRNDKLALMSRLPRVAAVHATRGYASLLAVQLQEAWDVVVIDGYGSGWALELIAARCRRSGVARPRLIYVSHNDESALWQSMAASMNASLLKKLAVRQNYWKVRALEQAVLRQADLITTITGADAEAYAAHVPQTPHTVLTPGYSGSTRPHRAITAETPRRLVMVGSFRWLIKHENLRRFVAAADSVFHDHGIELHVIGDIPPTLLDALRLQTRASFFHGYVDDIRGYFDQARMAVVPELVGGGFKLKFLDYIFNRVPVATITAAASGLSPELMECLICGDDFSSLIAAIVSHMDDVQHLNELQDRAYLAASSLFDWDDRGRQLLAAVESLDQPATDRGAATPHSERRTDVIPPVGLPRSAGLNIDTEVAS